MNVNLLTSSTSFREYRRRQKIFKTKNTLNLYSIFIVFKRAISYYDFDFDTNDAYANFNELNEFIHKIDRSISKYTNEISIKITFDVHWIYTEYVQKLNFESKSNKNARHIYDNENNAIDFENNTINNEIESIKRTLNTISTNIQFMNHANEQILMNFKKIRQIALIR